MIFEKYKMARKIHACGIMNEIKRAFHVLRCNLDHINRSVDIVVNCDSIKYRLVDLESLFIISPRYEEWMGQYLTPMKGDCFVDIGAHIGKYALQVAKTVGNTGKVIAVEPTPDVFRHWCLE